MIRGLHTATSGMMAQWESMNVVSNNIANVNTAGYKKDVAVFKSFPEMLLRRLNDDGVMNFKLGSYDKAPVIGKMGTGVELNSVYTTFADAGTPRRTDNDFDLMLNGTGFFVISTDEGTRFTRNGEFTIDQNSYLVTQNGEKVLGEKGPIQITKESFKVDKQGVVTQESELTEEYLDKLQIVSFYDLRGLNKVGNNLYAESPQSGKMIELTQENGRPTVLQGYKETSNVSVVNEMVKMISTQRAYEANQKAVQTSDEIMGYISSKIGTVS